MIEKEYRKQLVSQEIKELFSNIDKFIYAKNTVIDDIKKNFLNCSNCN